MTKTNTTAGVHLLCSRCGASKHEDEFYADRRKKTGRASRCKACNKEVTAAWHRDNRARSEATIAAWRAKNADKMPAIQRKYSLKRNYGITPEQYDSMLLDQGGRCAVCQQVCQTLVVDHCHSTSRVRGLLCIQCNSGIGMLQDDPDRLRAALAYLERVREPALH